MVLAPPLCFVLCGECVCVCVCVCAAQYCLSSALVQSAKGNPYQSCVAWGTQSEVDSCAVSDVPRTRLAQVVSGWYQRRCGRRCDSGVAPWSSPQGGGVWLADAPSVKLCTEAGGIMAVQLANPCYAPRTGGMKAIVPIPALSVGVVGLSRR